MSVPMITYYKISKNDNIYRADTNEYNNFKSTGEVILSQKSPYFFGLSSETVEQYGIVFEFVAQKDYNLVQLDDVGTAKSLYDSAPPEIKTILTANYGYNAKTQTIGRRDSVSKKDKQLSTYLCEAGYDGYAILHMETDFGGDFHAEIMICDTTNISFSRIITTDPKIIASAIDKNNLVNREKERVGNKKQRISQFSQPPPKTLFGDDDDDEPPSKTLFGNDKPRPKTLFDDDDEPMTGGKRKTKSMKKKKNNKKKQKKTRTARK